jgi:polar amino acid transport system substrate-binding protein
LQYKLIIITFVFVTASLLGLTGCTRSPEKNFISLDDLATEKVGVVTGGTFDKYLLKRLPNATPVYFNDHTSMIAAIRAHQISGAVFDEPVARILDVQHSDLHILPERLSTDMYALAFNPQKTELLAEFNTMLAELRANGTLNQIVDNWFSSDFTSHSMPKLPAVDGSNGTLRFATNLTQEPFAFVSGNAHQPSGYEIELVTRFAHRMNMKLEIQNMDIGAIIPSLLSGKSDFGGCCMAVTEERKKSINFSEPDYQGGTVVVVMKPKEQSDVTYFTSLDELANEKVAVITGGTGDKDLLGRLPHATPVYFNDQTAMIAATQIRQVSAMVFSEPSARVLALQNHHFMVLPEPISVNNYAMAFAPQETELLAKFNAMLAELKADGTLDKIQDNWFSPNPENRNMPQLLQTDGTNGTLCFATYACVEPMSFIGKGRQVVGFEVELAVRFANRMNMNLKIQEMDFGAIIPSLLSGKSNFGGSCITITEERKKSVNFTDSYYRGASVLVVLKPNAATKGLWQELKQSFIGNFVTEHRYKLLLSGLVTTIVISLGSVILGTLLGFAVCMMRMSNNRILSNLARCYIDVLRGIPVLVLLMLVYYVILGSWQLSPVFISIITFSLNFAAYVSEIMRAAIENVDKGQVDASKAIGFNSIQTFRYIVFPQAARMALPVYKGEFISMVKMTSVVGYVAIMDLTKASDLIRSRTFDAAFPLFVIAFIYFIITYLLVWGLSRIELSIDPKQRKREVKL